MSANEELRSIVETAMNAELEGRRFYRNAASKNDNPTIKGMFEALARAEEHHLECIDRIAKGRFDLPALPANARVETERVFGELDPWLQKKARSTDSDIDALDIALELEHHACEFYGNWAASAADTKVRSFCQRMMAEERDHVQVLTGVREFIAKPGGKKLGG